MKKEITIFICEDEETRKEICHKYFDTNKITYANIFPAEKRKEIVKAIEEIDGFPGFNLLSIRWI